MTDLNLLDAINPVVNILGGVAGVTIIYFVIVVWQNKKNTTILKKIHAQLHKTKERETQLIMEQSRLSSELATLNRRIARWRK
ncbi:hypothetical protein CCP3SC15_1440010 [Gammaproteobacteria bacterium]